MSARPGWSITFQPARTSQPDLRGRRSPAPRKAYADADAWPQWNAEIKRTSLDGPLALGTAAKVAFGTGLRLRFRVVEFEDGRLFTSLGLIFMVSEFI